MTIALIISLTNGLNNYLNRYNVDMMTQTYTEYSTYNLKVFPG